MKYRWVAVFVLATLVAVFAGCSKPETPQQIAAEFWQAMAESDANDVADLSTLANTNEFDAFKRDWLNTLPDFGRVVIDGSEATIATSLPAENATAGERRNVLTYLVQQNDQWLVDYQRTREAVISRSPLSDLQSDISTLREQFDDAVGRSSEQISEQMDQLVQDFKVYSEEAGEKAEEALEIFGESLENFRKQIKESLDEAQKNRPKSEKPPQESLEQAAI